MRNIINISLPEELGRIVKKEVKKGNFASTSEYIRYLLRLHSNDLVAYEVEKSRQEIMAGKGKVLRSLRDLR